MANKRLMRCGKEIYAWGQEGSIADIKEKACCCRWCKENLTCKYCQEYFDAEKILSKHGFNELRGKKGEE